uniref:Beta-1,2-xylosyltransferase isoform 2 n=1 Tax=Lemna minor TaxID=4472 RepID=Q0PMD1_LEMMI|nr:beta-1,2-xylosyltransferase isoform 2 [Lemna minor]
MALVNSRGSRVRRIAKPTFVFLLINVVCLLYFFRQNPNPIPDACLHGECDKPPILVTPRRWNLKPWPILPSFLPWVPSSHPAQGSCEAYFGNSFNRRTEMLKKVEGRGWFQCLYSDTLRSSVCQGGNLRMDPERIRMSKGGEDLEEVMKREEEEELPKFEEGSFQIESGYGSGGEVGERIATDEVLDNVVPKGAVHVHTMRNLISSIQIVGPGHLQCSQWIDEPVLLVTRFEYANLFHTVTDWYSAYASSRIANLPSRPHLIFVDGHCRAEQLEDMWRALFSTVRYSKNFSQPICFRHVVLSPLGYETALFKGLSESFSCEGAPANRLKVNPDDQKTARLAEFGEMIRAAFDFPVVDPSIDPLTKSILFVRREDYVAHPRHSGRVESRLTNEQEVFDFLHNWASHHRGRCNISMVNGLFAHMGMKEQLKAIMEASVVVGAHGAGLTHLVAARSTTVVLEILSSQYRRPHFQLISRWKGLDYHAINLAGSFADPREVVEKLTGIVDRLGC